MSAKQPTRKPTGKRKESDASAQEGRERKRAAKRKGLKAGSRQQVEQAGKKSGTKQAKDPRIGSRKPVALIVDEKRSKPVAPKAVKEKKLVMTPEQELASIENDDRLNDLLDRLDAGELQARHLFAKKQKSKKKSKTPKTKKSLSAKLCC